jgi:hypothetical protein
MAASNFFYFNPFVDNLAKGKFNFSSDSTSTITAVMCNAANAPVAANGALADLTTIDHTNLPGRVLEITSSAQTSGVYKLTLADKTLTATGAVPAFRYVALYDDDSTGDLLIGYYDYGSEITMASGDKFELDLDQVEGALKLAPAA